MSVIEFVLRENPHAAGEVPSGYYPVPARTAKVGTPRLIQLIEKRCTLTSADIKAVLSALSDSLADSLAEGAMVEVDELGSFAPSLESSQKITDPANRQIARHLKVGGVVFRPKKALLKKLDNATFRRSEVVNPQSVRLTSDELRNCVRSFFASGSQPFMTCSDFERITSFKPTRARRLLKSLCSEGFLTKYGRKNAPCYTLSTPLT